MSSTNKTEKIGLSQWESTDPVSVEDFNSDFRTLDGLVGATLDGLHLELVRDVTVPANNAHSLEIDVSGIEFGKYLMVIVEDVKVKSCQMDINASSDKPLTAVTGARQIFFTMKDPDTAPAILSVCSDMSAKVSPAKSSGISSLYMSFLAFNSSFTTDMHFKIWGIW